MGTPGHSDARDPDRRHRFRRRGVEALLESSSGLHNAGFRGRFVRARGRQRSERKRV
jgi:hypothetical protein